VFTLAMCYLDSAKSASSPNIVPPEIPPPAGENAAVRDDPASST